MEEREKERRTGEDTEGCEGHTLVADEGENLALGRPLHDGVHGLEDGEGGLARPPCVLVRACDGP